MAEQLQKENEELKNKVQELEDKLKKYTNGDNHKRYYEKNKEKIKEQGTTYLKKLKEENPEKLKEYRRTYYLKKKQLKDPTKNDNNILN
jgi:predicted MPP superfamily phosphohydrolase